MSGIDSRFIDFKKPSHQGLRPSQSVLYVFQEDHGFDVLESVRKSDTVWELAQSDSDETLADAVVVYVIDTDNFIVADSGFFTITSHGKDAIGEWYFLDYENAGGSITTIPEDYVQTLFKVIDENNIRIQVNSGSLGASGGSSSGGGGGSGGSFVGSCQRFTGCPGRGSTNTNVVRWSTNRTNQGTDIVVVQSSTNGDSFVVQSNGWYSINARIYNFSSGLTTFQIRASSAVNNTVDYSETELLANTWIPHNDVGSVSALEYLTANTVIWIVSDRAIANSSPGLNSVSISRVA